MRRIMFAFAVLPLVACAGFGSTSPAGSRVDTPQDGDAGPDGGIQTVSGGAAQTNAQPPAGIVDGIFVSASKGSDSTADGTAANPYQTLSAAIPAAVRAGKRVIACNETFAESVTLTSGVSLYGAYDCTQSPWAASSMHAKIVSPVSPAVIAIDVVLPTRLDGIDIIAPDQTAPQASSIGVMSSNATALVLANLTVHAGNAGNGVDGVEGKQLVNDTTTNGGVFASAQTCGPFEPLPVGSADIPNCYSLLNKPFQRAGSAGGTNSCGGAPVIVGAGGSGGVGGTAYCESVDTTTPSGTHYNGDYAWPVASAGTAVPFAATGATAGAGADGTQGAPGANGASGQLGTVTSAGFTPGDGILGGNGVGGIGGGGGAGQGTPAPVVCGYLSRGNLYEGGPGGGAGGCPGVAGSAGTGGGASIAIVSLNGGIALISARLETGVGGRGGKGTLGSNPTAGGDPGFADQASAAGRGGIGGFSGVSGSGAGGASIGIAFVGNAVNADAATTFTVGLAGAGVDAITSADGSKTIPASPAGQNGSSVAF